MEVIFKKWVAVIVAITFLWTNCIWAGGLSGFSYRFSSDKLGAETQVLRYASFANELQLGGIALSMIARHAVENNLALHQEWEGRGGISEDIQGRLADKRAGFKIGFSESSVYVVRGAFLHRYSIDNQTEDPLYISARLREYENNPQVKIYDDDVVLAGQNRRLKIFLIAPEIRPYLADISQFMVGDLEEVVSAQIVSGIEQVEHNGKVLGAIAKDNLVLDGTRRLSSDGSVMDVGLRSVKRGVRDRVVDTEAPSRFIYIKRGKIRVTYLNPQGVATTSVELSAGNGIILGTGYEIEYLEDSVILDANDIKKSDISGQGIVIDGSCDLAGKKFKIFTPDSNLLLSGIFTGGKGVKSPLHYHSPRTGQTEPRPEAVVILEGKVKIDVYSKDWQYVRTIVAEKGDIIYLSEAHRFEFLEDTKFMEVKPGPYPGSDALDKVVKPEPKQVPAKYQNLVIVINSQHGAGKSSLTHYVANKTGLPVFSAGEMKRRMAQDMEMSIEQFNEYLEQHPDEKKAVNDRIDQAQLEAIRKGGVIIDSSFGAYLVEKARDELAQRGIRIFKVFIKADVDVRAQRVAIAKRQGDTLGDVESIKTNLQERDEYDRNQFLELSGGMYDIFNESNYDIVFDNTHTVIEDVERFAIRVVDGIQYPGKVKRAYGDMVQGDVRITFNVQRMEIQYSGKDKLFREEEENLKRSLKNWLDTVPPEKQPHELEILVTENIDEISQHRPRLIELHRVMLRGPPGVTDEEKEPYRLFADGVVWHEGYHFLNPTANEEQACDATVEYFKTRTDILEATIKVLDPKTPNRFFAESGWLDELRQASGDVQTVVSPDTVSISEEPFGDRIERAEGGYSMGERVLENRVDFGWVRYYITNVLGESLLELRAKEALTEVLAIVDTDEEKVFQAVDEIYNKYVKGVSLLYKWNFFKAFYFGLHPDFKRNFEVFAKIYDDEGKAIDTVISESEKTGYGIFRTVCGSLDYMYKVRSKEDWEKLKKLSELKPRFVYVGGGGQGATILARQFVSWIRELPYRLKKKYSKNPIVVNIFAISDDGGSSGIMQVELRQTGEWSVYFFSPGDAAAIVGRQTDNDLKEDLYIYESLGRMSAVINVNTATEEQLLSVFTKKEAKGIIDKRQEIGKFVSKDQIKEIINDPQRFKKIEPVLRFSDENTVATVEELLIAQLAEYRRKVEKGEVLKKLGKAVKKFPDDWGYFIANNIALARIIDEEFIKPGHIKLLEASWKNLVMIGYLVQNGMIIKGRLKADGSIEIPAQMRDLQGLEGLLHAVGAFGSAMVPSTQDEAYQSAVLEAGLLEVNGDSYVYRLGEDDKIRVTPAVRVKDEFGSDLRKTAVEIGGEENEERKKRNETPTFDERKFNEMMEKEFTTKLNPRRIWNAGVVRKMGTRGFKYKDKKGQDITPPTANLSYTVKDKKITVSIDEQPSFILSEMEGEEGKTQVKPVTGSTVYIVEMGVDEDTGLPKIIKQRRLKKRTQVSTDTSKMYLRVGDHIIGIASRLVEGQTFITDEMLHSPVERYFYKKAELIEGNRFDESMGKDKRGNLVKKIRTMKPTEKPKAAGRAIKTIISAQKAIISGESSLFTSVLAGLAIDRIPQALCKSADIPRIYMWKISEDLETAGLSLREQILRIEDAVKEATGKPIRFEQMFSHIVIAEVPENIRAQFQQERGKKLAKLGDTKVARDILLGKEKLSKFLPSPIYEVTEEDLEFLHKRKIRVVRTSYVVLHEGRVVYDKEKSTRFIDSLADEYRYWHAHKVGCKGQEVFYPIAKLQEQFDEIMRQCDEPARLAFYIDRGDYGIERFDLEIPKLENLKDDEVYMDFTAWYVVMYIYNRLYTLGGRRVVIDTDEYVFQKVLDKFNNMFVKDRRYPVDKFFKLVYGGFEIVQGTPGEVLSKPGYSQLVYNKPVPKETKLLGISISDRYIKVVVLNGDEIQGRPISISWDPEEYDTIDRFLDAVYEKVRRKVKKSVLDDMYAIGVSWRGVVIGNQIKSFLPITRILDAKDFLDFADRLSKRFGGKYVKLVNDANAVGVNEVNERRDKGGLKNTLVLKLLGGIGGAYVDSNGVREDLLTELGNIILDLPYEAKGHALTGIPGVFQQYLTYDMALDIADRIGLELKGNVEDKIRKLRELYQDGNKEAELVYETFARYLAWAIASLYHILNIEEVVLSGGLVFKGPGEFVKEKVEENLEKILPVGSGIKIVLGTFQKVPRMFRFAHTRGAALAAYASKVMDELINKIKKDADSIGDFKESKVINDTFHELEKYPEFTDEVRIAFIRGDQRIQEFTVHMPKQEFLQRDKRFGEIIEEYLVGYVYNRLATFGAERVFVDNEYVYNILRNWYEYENMDFKKIKDSTDKRKPYWGMTDYLNMVYECRKKKDCGNLIELKTTEEIEAVKKVVVPSQITFDKKGNVVGLDIGGSDIKVVVFNSNGEIVYYEEMPWTPKRYTKIKDHLDKIYELLDRALQRAGLAADNLQGIGVSINVALNGQRITGKGPVMGKLEGADAEQFQNLAGILKEKYKKTVFVINDGDAGAFWAAQDMQLKETLFLAFGTGLAAGYVDSDRNIRGYLGEMGNVSMDIWKKASRHSVTGMTGAAQMYLSQRPIIDAGRLAEQKGIDLLQEAINRGLIKKVSEVESISLEFVRDIVEGLTDEGVIKKIKKVKKKIDGFSYTDPKKVDKLCEGLKEEGIDVIKMAFEKGFLKDTDGKIKVGIRRLTEAKMLEVFQKLLEDGTEEQKKKCTEIMKQIGRYLAVFIAEVRDYLPVQNVVIAGRVTKGKSGRILIKSANKHMQKLGLKGIQIKVPEAPSGVSLKLRPKDAGKTVAEVYKGISQAIGAAYFAMQKFQSQHTTPAYPISKKGEGREETGLFNIKAQKEGRFEVVSFKVEDPQIQQKVEQYYSIDMLGRVLAKLASYYGEGVYRFIQEIEVVDNINGLRLEDEGGLAELMDSKVRIDIDAFRSESLLFDVLEHEFLHNIIGLLNIDKGTDEVTATYMNIKRFLSEGEKYRKGIIDVLKADDNGLDVSGDYVRLLERILELEAQGELTDAKAISAVVHYLLTTPRYENLRTELGIRNEAVWQEAVQQTRERMEAALEVYDDLIRAKYGIEKGVSEDVVRKVKETEELVIKVIKTFRGIKIDGLDKLGKRLAGIIAGAVKVASKLYEIASLPLAMTGDSYCIVLDRDRIPEELMDDWERRIKGLEGSGMFKVTYSLDEALKDYQPKNIIHLIDPADIKEKMPEGMLYLPMPYLRSSLYMAAVVVSSGGDVDKLNPLVKGLIGDLYSQILGRSITAQDLERLFKAPWLILPEIRSVLGEINKLRTALVEIEKAA